ncbi:DUF4340 domain-containing protein, partial [candidate division KSB1 bacterium]|nr:DUF4340 domain-containing protein [candidate division KSB1 bacterium]
GSNVYARIAGSPDVFMTTTSLNSNVEKSLFDFRDKKILPFEKNQVNGVEIRNRKGRFVLDKEGAYWDIVSPVNMRADASKINTILDRTSYQSAKSFIEEDPRNLKEYGLQNPSMELTLILGENRAKKTLLIGDLEYGTYYGRDEAKSPVFTIDTSYVSLLNVSIADLRNKKLTDFSTADIDRVEIKVADSLYICVRDSANEWSVATPVQGKAKSWKISSILTDVAALKAEAFVDDAPKSLRPYGLDAPRVQLKLFQQDNLLCETLFGKNKDDKLIYCKTGDEKTVALVKKESFDKANIKLNDIFEPPGPDTETLPK